MTLLCSMTIKTQGESENFEDAIAELTKHSKRDTERCNRIGTDQGSNQRTLKTINIINMKFQMVKFPHFASDL
jgi:hypothetical protein